MSSMPLRRVPRECLRAAVEYSWRADVRSWLLWRSRVTDWRGVIANGSPQPHLITVSGAAEARRASLPNN